MTENEMTQINLQLPIKLLKQFDETWPQVYPHFSERQGRSAVIRDLMQKFVDKHPKNPETGPGISPAENNRCMSPKRANPTALEPAGK